MVRSARGCANTICAHTYDTFRIMTVTRKPCRFLLTYTAVETLVQGLCNSNTTKSEPPSSSTAMRALSLTWMFSLLVSSAALVLE